MASKQRIAFVANTSWSIYKFRLYLIEKLLAKGYSIFVLAPRDPYTALFEEIPGLTYLELSHFRGKSISPFQDRLLLKELFHHYRTIRPHLIFHYTIKANIIGTRAAAKARIPSVSVITGLGYAFSGIPLIGAVVKQMYRSVLRKSTEVWFLNDDDREFFTSKRLVNPKKTFILPGEGVDSERFYAAPYGPRQDSNPGPADHPPSGEARRDFVTFLLIGRMIRHKGIFEFVEAAGRLRQQGLSVQCQLLGFFDEKNPVAIRRQQVEEWDRQGIISYLGHTDDVVPYIEKADCIVLPSYREGMPLSLLEGGSMCKALIATDTAGCRAIIKEGVNGYLCREKDGASLAEKMSAYYHLPAEAKTRMGTEGRNIVVRQFTREIVAGIYLDKIDRLRVH
jgi:glycosyltransferase involved in cell wall biosynthesis